ncbi:MAG: serine/threonine protein kinase [Deltaproteobacteria bacterium]|nr:serine/threonine protein kinase [Deltaproteobacteria bacterium]
MLALPFGPYTLLRRIAVGGMSEVFLAQRGAETLVVKQILPQLARDPDLVQLFAHEAAVAKELQHPGIVRLLDFGQHEDTYFLALEYVDGLDLDELIRLMRRPRGGAAGEGRAAGGHPAGGVPAGGLRAGGLPACHVASVGILVARALHFAHEARDAAGAPLEVIHRDISPQNVFLGRDGAVKLGDFGIARTRLRARHTQTGVLRGKLAYLAPERLTGAEATRAVDIYAMGVVLFESLAGRRPFTGDDATLLSLVRTESPPALASIVPDIDPRFAAIVARAMAREPAERFPDAGALADAIEELEIASPREALAGYVAAACAERDERMRGGDEASPRRAGRAGTETLPGQGETTLPGDLSSVLPTRVETPILRVSTADPTVVTTPPGDRIAFEPHTVPVVAVVGDPAAAATSPAIALPPAPSVLHVPPAFSARRAAFMVASLLALLLVGGWVVGSRSSEADLNAPEAPTAAPSSTPVAAVPPSSPPAPVSDRALEQAAVNALEPSVPSPKRRGSPARKRAKARAPVRATPPSSVSATGELSIDSEPWSYVRIGGRAMGPTPIAHLALPAGRHLVALENPDRGLVSSVWVFIKPGERTTARVRLGDRRGRRR